MYNGQVTRVWLFVYSFNLNIDNIQPWIMIILPLGIINKRSHATHEPTKKVNGTIITPVTNMENGVSYMWQCGTYNAIHSRRESNLMGRLYVVM